MSLCVQDGDLSSVRFLLNGKNIRSLLIDGFRIECATICRERHRIPDRLILRIEIDLRIVFFERKCIAGLNRLSGAIWGCIPRLENFAFQVKGRLLLQYFIKRQCFGSLGIFIQSIQILPLLTIVINNLFGLPLRVYISVFGKFFRPIKGLFLPLAIFVVPAQEFYTVFIGWSARIRIAGNVIKKVSANGLGYFRFLRLVRKGSIRIIQCKRSDGRRCPNMLFSIGRGIRNGIRIRVAQFVHRLECRHTAVRQCKQCQFFIAIVFAVSRCCNVRPVFRIMCQQKRTARNDITARILQIGAAIIDTAILCFRVHHAISFERERAGALT